MNLELVLQQGISQAIQSIFDISIASSEVALQPTKKDFEGNYTFVTFALTKPLRRSPAEIGEKIGAYLQANTEVVSAYNVVQGFLNITVSQAAWVQVFESIRQQSSYGVAASNGQKVMVEYSSPNTNKPLHLGHLRNNFLGYSVAEILKANGYEVRKTNIVNNRGIHICKSMLAYQLFGEGETPESAGIKGDHLVGKYYVVFDKAYKAQIAELVAQGIGQEEAEKQAPLIKQAQAMLLDWEKGEPEVIALWEKMNAWVYAGFDATYRKMGVDFDKMYYESDTYLLGKLRVEEGLEKGLFFKKEDGSIWIDLSDVGLDQKLLLRRDGTSVYITQDLGLADQKYEDFPMQKSVYVVGNEQDYHFEVLFAIMKKLGRPYADGLFHLSYGMVDLPSGKMKSREGTVVDADDLMQEMIETAEAETRERGKIDSLTPDEAKNLYEMLALGALKYYLLKVDPKKRMMFNPQESIALQGNTGPFIQYTHARICSILRKAAQLGVSLDNIASPTSLHVSEQELISVLNQYPTRLNEAAENYSPALIGQYAYELAKTYNQFYSEVSIISEADERNRNFRIALSKTVAETINKALALLGIKSPERM